MERIKLTKREKKVLGALQTNTFDQLSQDDRHAVHSLLSRGLAEASFFEGGEVADARLSFKGECYMEQNPKLRNPFNWLPVVMVVNLIILVNLIVLIVKLIK